MVLPAAADGEEVTIVPRCLVQAATLAIVVGVAFGACATGAAASGHRAKTSISLNTFPKPFGYVKSPRAKACADGRRIAIFDQRGAHQRPSRDRLVATATSYRYHGGYQWRAKRVQEADLYARAKATPRCGGAHSKTVGTPAPGSRGTAGACPDPNHHSCYFEQLHLDDDNNFCANWNSSHGDCDGVTWVKRYSTADDLFWQTCCNFANFHWNGYVGGYRDAALYVRDDHGYHPLKGYLEGSLPGPGSDRFTIRDAFSTEAPDSHWCTQDIQGTKPGDFGAPLHFDFEGGSLGADVYIYGELVQQGYGCG